MGSMMMPNHNDTGMPSDLAAPGPMAEHPFAPQGHGQSEEADCLLMVAYGVTAVTSSQLVSARSFPAISVAPARIADLPFAGPLNGVDPPPPRHDV